ncbi:MAG TPA: hypothetical protein VG755_19475, partial [Nannocystaceae bacterium]|nr:hypothetical protein [Nannocystaceae bacterium]
AALEKLEERLWTARDETQRERLDTVKLSGELERLKEQLERTRAVESSKAADIERLGSELRRIELERNEATGMLRAREDELARMRRELDALASSSDDLQRLRTELDVRARELAELGTQLEHARATQREAENALRRREQQLVDAGAELERLHRELDERTLVASGVQGELDVRMVELEQLAASIGDLQQQVEALREDRRQGESRAVELQRQVEELAAERELLRRHLREREQELDDVASAQESSGAELILLRRELEAASEANERLTESLNAGAVEGEDEERARMRDWPDAAVAEVLRLRAELGSRRDSSELTAARERVEDATGDRGRLRRVQLELDIRAQEHEHVLALLDGAEQRIWEMTDASDRNAARLAAGLAQLEKQREQLDDTLEELEVTRNLLATAQARNIEQERLLASERAKLARVGLGAEPATSSGNESDNVDELFADLDAGYRSSVDAQPILLPTAATRAAAAADRRADGVPQPVTDTGSAGSGSRAIELRSSPRVVVEPLADDAWVGPGEEASKEAKPGPTK